MITKSNIKSMRAITYFIIMWIVVGIGMFVLPIKSRFGHDLEVFIVCMLFVMSVSISAVVWFQNTPRFVFLRNESNQLSVSKIKFIIVFSTIATIIGNILVAIDRILVRGIDYSAGLRNARYQWLNGGVEGNVLGVAGNLLIPFAFCALFMGLYHWENLSIKYGLLGILIGFGGEFGLAMLNGGRSNILLSTEFAVAVCVIRQYHGKSFVPKIKAKAILLFGFVAGVAIISYIVSIFFAFSDNNLEYIERLSMRMGATISDSYEGNQMMNIIIAIFLYLFHGINYIGAQITYAGGFADLSHNMTLRGIMTVLSRFPGVDYQSQLPAFDGGGGNFMALPGQILYDYTLVFFIPVCIMIGIFAGSMLKLLNKQGRSYSCSEVLFVIVVMLVLIHSPIGMAIGFSYFFFMVFAMIAMEIFSCIKYGKGSSWTMLKAAKI